MGTEAAKGTEGSNVAMELSPTNTAGERAPSAVSFPATEPDEAVLVDRAIGGDGDAFAALYTRHVDRVYRHCYYYMGNRADAEDVAQQTFLRAWQAIGRYRRGKAPFQAWLLTIAGNLSISRLRLAREIPHCMDGREEATEDDPQDIIATLDSCDVVRRAVLELKPERQQVIILRFIEGLSVSEVAAALGKSENAVSVMQHRALGELRRRLDEGQPEPKPHARAVQALKDAVLRATGHG
jgi:RNA polymerase sigma-70 factor (ECF subfamily)